jgi:predicted  nucleic acid-binding Zn-ribbon protein
VTGDLHRLWNLHGLDEEAARLRAALTQHPAEKKAAEARLAEERAAVEVNRTTVSASQKQRRELERQADAFTVEEKKFQGQLANVKKNEEYQALLHEIEMVKAKRSDLETQVLEQLETEERLVAERPALEAALAKAETEVREKIAKIEALEAEARRALEAIDSRRAAELRELEAPTKSRYERIHSSRQGQAVVAVDKNACGGCYRALPPQALQEARKRDRLMTCEGCGRLLIYPPDTP